MIAQNGLSKPATRALARFLAKANLTSSNFRHAPDHLSPFPDPAAPDSFALRRSKVDNGPRKSSGLNRAFAVISSIIRMSSNVSLEEKRISVSDRVSYESLITETGCIVN